MHEGESLLESARGRSGDAEALESWVVVQSMKAAAMEKMRVRVRCMVKLVKFCRWGDIRSEDPAARERERERERERTVTVIGEEVG